MAQLGELQKVYNELEKRNVEAIAVSNEEKSRSEHEAVKKHFGQLPPFKIVADLGYRRTRKYDRTTIYLIDERGVIRQVFPMEIYNRPPWWAIINEIDRLFGPPAD